MLSAAALTTLFSLASLSLAQVTVIPSDVVVGASDTTTATVSVIATGISSSSSNGAALAAATNAPGFLIELDLSINLNGDLVYPNGELCPCQYFPGYNNNPYVVYTSAPSQVVTVCQTCAITTLPTVVPAPGGNLQNVTVTNCPTSTQTVIVANTGVASGVPVQPAPAPGFAVQASSAAGKAALPVAFAAVAAAVAFAF